MSWFEEYEIVTSLDEAAQMLAEPGSAIIGGGSRLVAQKPDHIHKLIDLMPLGLDRLSENEEELNLEARVRLQIIAERDDFGGVLSKAVLSMAHSENLRNQMTVAGETAWPFHLNEWQVTLMALDALVHRHDREATPMAEYLADETREGIISAVSIFKRPDWRFGFDRVAPADGARPLLVFAGAAKVVGAEAAGARIEDLRLALGNLSPLPQRLTVLEDRLRGQSVAELTGFTLESGDREGLLVEDSHNADADTKWNWAGTLLTRFFESHAKGQG